MYYMCECMCDVRMYYVCGCTDMTVWVCVPMQRSEQDIGCLPLSLIASEQTGSSTELEDNLFGSGYWPVSSWGPSGSTPSMLVFSTHWNPKEVDSDTSEGVSNHRVNGLAAREGRSREQKWRIIFLLPRPLIFAKSHPPGFWEESCFIT